MRTDFRPYRRELIVSSKADWDMWPGPQGQLGSRNDPLSSSTTPSAGSRSTTSTSSIRTGSTPGHPWTKRSARWPVRFGLAKPVTSASRPTPPNTPPKQRRSRIGPEIHLSSTSRRTTCSTDGSNRVSQERASLGRHGRDLVHGARAGSAHRPVRDRRCRRHRPGHLRPTLPASMLTEAVLAKIHGLKATADARGQSLAQMALAWVLRDPVVASTLSARRASHSSTRTSAR